jgi:RNA polymerase primary sigma factor
MKEHMLLQRYMQDVSKFSRISPEEEIELGKRIESGDLKAKEKLINSNLRLAVKLSLGFCRGNISIMDTIQNANIGLMRAAEKFDYRKGVRFSTYAAFWIKQTIARARIKENSSLSISYRKEENKKKMRNFLMEKLTSTGNVPCAGDLAEEFKTKKSEAVEALQSFSQNSVLHYYEEDGLETDTLSAMQDNRYNPETIVEKEALSLDIQKALSCLPTRDSKIIEKRFGLGTGQRETLSQIGAAHSVTAEAARQIEKRVLVWMKMRFPALAFYYYVA